jgi:hypothetical protein
MFVTVGSVCCRCLTSFETGESIAEPSKERHEAAAALLGLSQEQKQRIAQGSAVIKQLMTPVLTVRLNISHRGCCCSSLMKRMALSWLTCHLRTFACRLKECVQHVCA